MLLPLAPSAAWPGAATLLPLTREGHADCGPRGKLAPSEAGHGLPPSQAAAFRGKACQGDASVSSPYLLGRAPCDGGLRLAGSCMLSLGKRWAWRAVAGSASAAGSADDSRCGGSRNYQARYRFISGVKDLRHGMRAAASGQKGRTSIWLHQRLSAGSRARRQHQL